MTVGVDAAVVMSWMPGTGGPFDPVRTIPPLSGKDLSAIVETRRLVMTDLQKRSYRIQDRYENDAGRVILTGVQALARLPIEQLRADRRLGRNTAAFLTGYQGSPLGGMGEEASRAAKLAPDLPIVVRAGANEELAASAVMGSQLVSSQPDARYDGVVGIWYGKAPGVDRAMDALRHAVYAGTSRWGGAVALVGDDPNAKSSTIPSSSAGVVADMHMPLLYPGDPAEVLDLGRHAVALSRFSGLWTAIKIVADVADGMTSVDLAPDRVQPIAPDGFDEATRRQPSGHLLTPYTVELEQEIYDVRYPLAVSYASKNDLNSTTVDPADAWIGIAASGITYRELREALTRLGLATDDDIAAAGIRLLRMQMPIPFDPQTVRTFARGVDTLVVVEEKQPFVEALITQALYASSHRPLVLGKQDAQGAPLFRTFGHLDADLIIGPLRRVLAERIGDRLVPEKPERQRIPVNLGSTRSPYYCSGCPHNRSTQVPEGSLVGAGIGCHTMALFMDDERVGDIAGITCMGNEGMQWIGMSDFVERDHLIQNLGDGTYFHSGQLAIQAARAAGVNITYKLLYNGTVAMTGGQDPQGQLSVGRVVRMLQASGVARVLVTTDEPGKYERGELPHGVEVWDRSRLLEAQEMLAKVPGVTVLIHDQRCAAELRRDRKRGQVVAPTERVVINPRICEGCGDCGQVSNCLSVQPIDTPFGRKTTIDQSTCNLDFSCIEGDCPSFMTIELDQSPKGAVVDGFTPPAVPEPTVAVPTDHFAMRITGIGGTGIVTVSQIIGTAGMLDGYTVTGLDQIGLSQKAGPVVSDVRLSRIGADATNRLGREQADLLLACDQLVAATDRALDVCEPGHTMVVGSTASTPTGEMILHPDLHLASPEELIEVIARETDSAAHHWADAEEITTALFGDAVMANTFVVGMAVQAGAIPISAESLEQAIELNGVAVEKNLAAFAWGRAQAHDPSSTAHLRSSEAVADATLPAALARRVDGLDVSTGLGPLVARLANDLIGFQDEATAAAYLDIVERVAAKDVELGIGSDLTREIAINLHKLTAYKDEYEVARLMLLDEGLAEAKRLAGPAAKIHYRLHPPMLRGLGMRNKMSIPIKGTPAIAALAKGKRLRGTKLDPFRFPEVRRLERALVPEYRRTIDTLLERVDTASYGLAVEIAGLPDAIRGYEELKMRRAAAYRSETASLLAEFRRMTSQPKTQ